MVLLQSSSRFHIHPSSSSSSRNPSRFCFTVRSSLPIPFKKAKYNKELQAAVNVVEKACRLCVDVKKSLFSSEGRILEKNDQSPVTVADFGVQALISLEMNRLFPSIPLVAEEDSTFLRSSVLADTVVSVVNDTMELGNTTLDRDDVLKAIDRGGKDAFSFGESPATYWVLDPIDGTRGFLKGSEALYVVGLALVIEGEIAVGVMGCPNWHADISKNPGTDDQENKTVPGQGILMVAHVGCGTWTKRLSNLLGSNGAEHIDWTRCYIDSCRFINEARFCIPESITWESLPLSRCLSSTTNAESVNDGQVLLLPTCCGRFFSNPLEVYVFFTFIGFKQKIVPLLHYEIAFPSARSSSC
ncbi:3'(2'),5'-bisphosphate nucleotidase [Thalictrum thalictroides]|uniref:3'(2'),5'-bisphosphate nucleotidase n=1 Tax=Thalictrum thalictroides TaxID=46969 RepID=A0A7J6UYD1_THATH|nr:3'(2'),5'-bisphosphate nucleotidase [Thalictrum thalictroides]